MQDRSDAGQDICWRGGMQEMDAVQQGCRTGRMQDGSDAVQDGCRTGGMQNRTDAGQDDCSTGRLQDSTDAGQVRYRIERMHSRVPVQNLCSRVPAFLICLERKTRNARLSLTLCIPTI